MTEREILERIARLDPEVETAGLPACFYCGADRYVFDLKRHEFVTTDNHDPACLWLQARALFADLPASVLARLPDE